MVFSIVMCGQSGDFIFYHRYGLRRRRRRIHGDYGPIILIFYHVGEDF